MNNGYITWTDIHFWSFLAHFFLEWEMFHTKVVEKIKTHFMFRTFFSPPWNFAIFEIKWKNISELGRPQMKIWHMCIACWVHKVTDECSEYIILLFNCNSGCMNVPHCHVIHTLSCFIVRVCLCMFLVLSKVEPVAPNFFFLHISKLFCCVVLVHWETFIWIYSDLACRICIWCMYDKGMWVVPMAST